MNRTTERILVAEDETNLRNELHEFLRMEGFDVICAADGREAFLAAKEHEPDLVISDLRMPDWDGPRLLLEMQADPQLRNTPIIFLTAMVDRKNVRAGMALGAADYLTKPFSLNELRATIHAQLDKRLRVNREIQEVSCQTGEDASRRIGEGLLKPVKSIRTEAETLLSIASLGDSSKIREHAEKILLETGKLELSLKNYQASAKGEQARTESSPVIG